MNKIIIEPSAYQYLCEWAEDYKMLLYDDVDYFKQCCLIVKNDTDIKLHIKKLHKPNSFKYTLFVDHLLAKGYFYRIKNPDNDCSVALNIIDNKESPEEVFKMVKIALTAYVHANLFLLYGNFVKKSERQLQTNSKNNESGDKTIVFRPFNGKLYAAEVGTHRSPEGVFEVRGHFRHYEKTGKVVWIEPYMKGTKDKTE